MIIWLLVEIHPQETIYPSYNHYRRNIVDWCRCHNESQQTALYRRPFSRISHIWYIRLMDKWLRFYDLPR